MKKVLLSVIGVAVAGALIAPTFIGQNAEREVKAIADAIDANPAYTVEIASYERSWFSSRGVLTVSMELPMPQPDGSTEVMTLDSGEMLLELQHGPVLTQFDGGLGLLSWQLTANDDNKRTSLNWSEDQALYQLTGSMGLTGNATYDDQIADVNYRSADGDFIVEMSGYRGNGTFGNDAFSYSGSHKTLVMGEASDPATITGIDLQTSANGSLIDALNGELLESDIVLSVANATQSGEEVLSGFAMTAGSELAETGDTLSVNVNTAVEAAQLPSGTASNLVMNVSFSRIDKEFTQAYQQLVNSTYGQPQEVMQQQLTALFEQYQQQVLAAKPEFSITELSGDLPKGSFSGQANVTFADIATIPANPTTDFWLQHILAEGAIEAAKPLVKDALRLQLQTVLAQQMPNQDVNSEQFQAMIEQQVEQVIAVYLQQGFIVENEQQYQSAVELKQGSLMLNGKQLPLM